MRDPDWRGPRHLSGVALIAIVLGVTSLLGWLFGGIRTPNGSFALFEYFLLTRDNLTDLKVWTVLTYGLFHGGFLHLLFNIIVLFFAGRVVEERLGKIGLITVFISGVFFGAVFHVLFAGSAAAIGASAGATALLSYFCLVLWRQQVTFLLFFVIPVTATGKIIFLVLFGLDLAFFITTDLLRTSMSGGVAYGAHVGGWAIGYLFFKFGSQPFIQRQWTESIGGKPEPLIKKPDWLKKKPAVDKRTGGKFSINFTNRKEAQKEVDRILDKISADGYGALTAKEKEMLDKHSDLLRK